MKKISVLILAMICIELFSFFDFDLVRSLDLNDLEDRIKLDNYLNENPKGLAFITSRIRLDTPENELMHYILIVTMYKYENAHFPVRVVYGSKCPDEILSVCINYFLATAHNTSSALILNDFLSRERYDEIHYLTVNKMLKMGRTPVGIMEKMYSKKGDKFLNAMITVSYKEILCKDIADMFIKEKDSEIYENIAYSLFFIAPSLCEKVMQNIFNKILKDPEKMGLFIPILERSGSAKAIGMLRKLTRHRNKKVSSNAKNRTKEIKTVIEIDWVSDKLKNPAGGGLDKIYEGMMEDPYGNYEFKDMIMAASYEDIDKLENMKRHLAYTMESGFLPIIDEINSLIFILKISKYPEIIKGL